MRLRARPCSLSSRRARRGSFPLAGEILAGAREVRGRFAAITDGLLDAVESARKEAEAAVSAAQRRRSPSPRRIPSLPDLTPRGPCVPVTPLSPRGEWKLC